jgi:hypothetical protein
MTKTVPVLAVVMNSITMTVSDVLGRKIGRDCTAGEWTAM